METGRGQKEKRIFEKRHIHVFLLSLFRRFEFLMFSFLPFISRFGVSPREDKPWHRVWRRVPEPGQSCACQHQSYTIKLEKTADFDLRKKKILEKSTTRCWEAGEWLAVFLTYELSSLRMSMVSGSLHTLWASQGWEECRGRPAACRTLPRTRPRAASRHRLQSDQPNQKYLNVNLPTHAF